MGCEELIEALRKEADEKVRDIWVEAEKEAGKVRADISLRLETLRQGIAAEKSSEEESEKVLLEAQNRVKMTRLTSEDMLCSRLYSLAASSLHILREQGYEDIFRKLALELPSFGWRKVRVNPDDPILAQKLFSGAEVITDSNITGGMELESEGGGIWVVNTLEKRLERAWPLMLPALMEKIYREVSKNGTPPGI